MKKIALLTLLLINLSLSFSLPRNQASPAIFSVTQSAGTILFRHTDSTQTIIPCQSVASIVSNADPSKIVSVWVVQQGDYDKIMQFDYSVCGFSTKQEAVDSVTVWASCVYVSDSAYTTILYTNTDSATITSYEVLNSQNAPPGSPSTGDVYLVGTSPTGAWVGHAKDIAEWNGSAWVFTDGVQGDFLYNATTALTYIFRSGNWVQTTGVPALNNGNNISSGLKIGTNNARSLTFETNNTNRGRFDSVGRFHIYNLPTSSTSDTFVTKSDLSGKLTKVGQSTFLSGVNTSLFPNGQEIVTESRDFRDSDIDKLLIVVGNDITLTMPDTIVFSEQLRTIGLKFLQGYTGCGYQPAHGFTTKALQLPNDGEFITLITGEYLGKSSVGSIANMQVNTDDGIVTLNKYLYDQSQNAIPLSGTVSGSPVTGDIELSTFKSIYNIAEGYKTTISFQEPSLQISTSYDNGDYINSIAIGEFGINGSQHFPDKFATGFAQMKDISDYVGFRGTATLSSGTVTVLTDKVLTGYKIYLSVNTPSGTQGFLSAPTGSIVDGTEFVINSTSATDDSTVNWWIAP